MKAKRSNNRPKSKNNPNGKAGKAKADWREYSERRRAGGLNRSGRMSRMADRARGPMGMDAGAPDRRVSAIPVPIAKSETKGSCRGPVGRFQMHPDDPEACGLKRACGRSRYRLRVSGIDPAVLQKIAARPGAAGALPTDAGGFGVPARRERMDAKYGGPGARMLDKTAMLQSLHGMICPVGTTDGGAGDAPSPGRLPQSLPPGTGGDAPADSAHADGPNRSAAVRSGRTPAMSPRSNGAARGLGAYAKMPRFRRDHPRTLCGKPARRSSVEGAFSATRAGPGCLVRAPKRRSRAVGLMPMAVCCNVTF